MRGELGAEGSILVEDKTGLLTLHEALDPKKQGLLVAPEKPAAHEPERGSDALDCPQVPDIFRL